MWFPGQPPLPFFLCFLEIFTYLTTIFLKTEEIYIFIYCLIGHGHYFHIYLLHCLHIYIGPLDIIAVCTSTHPFSPQ